MSSSTSGDRVLVAVAEEGADVGVDVERVPPALFAGFDDYALHPTERADLGPAGERPGARLGRWVAKEALLKAAGLGLRTPPHTILLPPQAPEHAAPRRHAAIDPAHWRRPLEAPSPELAGIAVTPLPASPGYRCAIAARTPARLEAVASIAGATRSATVDAVKWRRRVSAELTGNAPTCSGGRDPHDPKDSLWQARTT
ncbi:4'-phosphopantetheinyl transferase family protein [Serinibacter arcticus]|uniref:4'-phosphopantetheinyl transferase family protein n=1 Tax=Serinibacter arcticus TaxID=1655435 RepID=UPI001304A4D7|nr:4'-phosphopantetheinyl transferase superfamily protein [Serinibacter arcticus]